MAMSKEFQRLEQNFAENSNAAARIEAKLDALMRKTLSKEEIDSIKYPELREIKPLSSAVPYTIKEEQIDPKQSTIETPVSEASEQPKAPETQFVPEHLDTIVPPVVAAVPGREPSEGYDALTEGEAIKLVKGITDPVEQERYLAYERANKNRDRVLEAIVIDPNAQTQAQPTTSSSTTTTATTKPATTTTTTPKPPTPPAE